eukprot:2203229-Rhodomonas_salina.5
MSGTKICMRRALRTRCPVLRYAMLLPGDVMEIPPDLFTSGEGRTLSSFARARRCPISSWVSVGTRTVTWYRLRARYAMSASEIAYAAICLDAL